MADVVIIAVLAVIAFLGIRSYMGTLKHGCCGGGDHTKRIKVKDRNPSDYPYTVRMGVEGMSCSNCKLHVENALNEEQGVWAEVDLKKNTALVRMKERIPNERLTRDVEKAGYEVSAITEV